jgi:aspartyl protease family protein
MWKQVVPLFVVAVLVGWFMPAGHAPPSAAPSADAVARTATPDRKPNLPGSSNAGVVLDRQPDGHFYAEGDAAGQPVRFLIDTGATMVALTSADAERLGLYWTYNELQLVGRGASGDVQGKPVELAQLTVGGLTATNIQAVIIPNGLDVSLLGQSFLSKVGNVSIANDRMTLKN